MQLTGTSVRETLIDGFSIDLESRHGFKVERKWQDSKESHCDRFRSRSRGFRMTRDNRLAVFHADVENQTSSTPGAFSLRMKRD